MFTTTHPGRGADRRIREPPFLPCTAKRRRMRCAHLGVMKMRSFSHSGNLQHRSGHWKHPSAGRAHLCAPWRGGKLEGGSLCPFTPAKGGQCPAKTRAAGRERRPGTEPLARPFLPGVKGQCRAKRAGGHSDPTRAGVDPHANTIEVSKDTGARNRAHRRNAYARRANQSYFHDNSPPSRSAVLTWLPVFLINPNQPELFS
jgi:hypothetical protein